MERGDTVSWLDGSGDFVARASLQRSGGVRFRPAQMIGGEQEQPAQRRIVLLANPAEHRDVVRGLARFRRRFDGGWDDLPPAQREAALNNKRQPDDRSEEE